MSELFARNFDQVHEEVGTHEDGELGETQPETITLAEAELMAHHAHKEGFEQGQLAGATKALSEERTSREAQSNIALESLAESLKDIAARDQRMRTEIALDMTELMAGVGERILPDLFDSNIADVLMARAHTAVTLMAGTGKVSIRVPPELFDVLHPKLARLTDIGEARSMDLEIVADEQIDDGTIRIDWKNGFMEFDPGLASLDVLETLKEALLELRSQLEKI